MEDLNETLDYTLRNLETASRVDISPLKQHPLLAQWTKMISLAESEECLNEDSELDSVFISCSKLVDCFEKMIGQEEAKQVLNRGKEYYYMDHQEQESQLLLGVWLLTLLEMRKMQFLLN